MNSFYKEQKKLMEKALSSLMVMDSIDAAADQLKKEGKYPDADIEEYQFDKVEPLKTEYALTVTTLMQNFCAQLGFTLTKREEFEEAEVIS